MENELNRIYSKTYNFVYLRAKSILKNEEDVKILMQKIYVLAYQNADRLKNENLYEWLGKNVYRIGCQQCRKRKEREIPFLEMEKEELENQKPKHLKESIVFINDLLEQLPEMYQATLFAFYFDYLKVDEIAELMEVSPDVIKNRLNYARRYIKKAMEDAAEERQETYDFSVAVLCLALRQWAVEHCLGMTSAQSIYYSICKELKIPAEAIYLDGKEFAGVKNTLVYYKPDDWEPIMEELRAYEKKKGIDKRVLVYGMGGVIILAVVITVAALFLNKPKNEPAKKPKVTENTSDVKDKKKSEDDSDTPKATDDAEGQNTADDGNTQNPAQGEDAQEPQNNDTSQQDTTEYIFPNSNTTELTREEVQGKTKEELRIARNEIYARHGATFGVEDLDNYFKSKSWYTPKMSISELLDSVELSLVEEGNISLIQEVESGMQE